MHTLALQARMTCTPPPWMPCGRSHLGLQCLLWRALVSWASLGSTGATGLLQTQLYSPRQAAQVSKWYQLKCEWLNKTLAVVPVTWVILLQLCILKLLFSSALSYRCPQTQIHSLPPSCPSRTVHLLSSHPTSMAQVSQTLAVALLDPAYGR